MSLSDRAGATAGVVGVRRQMLAAPAGVAGGDVKIDTMLKMGKIRGGV